MLVNHVYLKNTFQLVASSFLEPNPEFMKEKSLFLFASNKGNLRICWWLFLNNQFPYKNFPLNVKWLWMSRINCRFFVHKNLTSFLMAWVLGVFLSGLIQELFRLIPETSILVSPISTPSGLTIGMTNI